MIYRYKVKLDNSESPMYSTTKTLKDFREDREAAIEWAKKHHYRYETERTTVYVEESEYTCEDNLTKDFAIRRNWIWHKYLQK